MPQVLDAETARPSSPVGERVVPLATILSSVALVVSLGVAWWTMTHDPLGPGLSSYDLSTPKAALLSYLKMEQNQDYRAALETTFEFDAKRTAEKAMTLEICKESEWQGSKILFIRFDENGIQKHEVCSFEKHADSGKWRQNSRYINLGFAAINGSTEEKRLNEMIKSWQEKGTFE
jgi:hypothetical protein